MGWKVNIEYIWKSSKNTADEIMDIFKKAGLDDFKKIELEWIEEENK